jgi:hypothetical protein
MRLITATTWRRFRCAFLSRVRRGALVSFVFTAILCGTPAAGCSLQTQRPAPSEKESRTPAQQKINSQLLYEVYRFRGEAKQKNVPPDPTGVKLDAKGRALVDVRARSRRRCRSRCWRSAARSSRRPPSAGRSSRGYHSTSWSGSPQIRRPGHRAGGASFNNK